MEDLIKKLKKTLADFQQAIQSRVQTNVLPATKSFIQSIQPAGGWQAGIERVKQTPLREFFLPTATEAEPFRQYISETAKSIPTAIGAALKFTSPYQAYRGITGKPVTGGEMLSDISKIMTPLYRLRPETPIISAGLGMLKEARAGAKTPQEIIAGGYKGLEELPWYGEALFPKNPKLATLTNIAFMGTMIARPYLAKKLNQLNLRAEEINNAAESLGVSPNTPVSEVAQIWKNKMMTTFRDVYQTGGTPELQAEAAKLNSAFDTLKRAGVLEKNWALIYETLRNQLGFINLGARIFGTPKEGEQVAVKFLPTPTGSKLAEKFGETALAKITSQPFRVPSGAVLVKAEIDGQPVNLPISKHLEWYKPVEKAAEQVAEKVKPEIPKIKVKSSDIDLLKKFANWEQVSDAEREKVGQIVTQKLGLLPEQWAYESGTGQRRLAQKALEQTGEILVTTKKPEVEATRLSQIKQAEEEALQQSIKEQAKIKISAPTKEAVSPVVGGETQEILGGLSRPSGKSIAQEKYAFNINLERLKLNPEEKQTLKSSIEAVKPELEKIKGKTLSNEEVIKAAKTSDILSKVTTREETLKAEAAILKARQKLVSLDREIDNLIKQGKTENLRDKMKDLIDSLRIVSSTAADTGRKLQSFSIEAGDESIRMAILKDIAKVESDTEKILREAANVDWENANSIAAFYRKFIKPTAREILDEYRYNNMLSNPRTHIRNAFSNLVQTVFTRPATLLVQGKVGETAKYYQGVIKNLPQATTAFLDAFSGKSGIAKPDIENIPTLKLPKVLTIPSRAMEAADRFFSTLIKGGEIAAGRTPEEAEKIAEYSLFRQGLKPEGQGKILNAIDEATAGVYQLGKKIPALRWFVPFVRTPMNFAKQWIEYSPMGVGTLWGATNKKEQLAKAMLGSIFTLIGAKLALEGNTTWAVPTDPKEKELFYASGRKPYSIRIGNRWVSMMYAEPFALALALPAAVKYYQSETKTALTDDQLTKLSKIIGATAEYLSQQTFLEGVGNFVSLLRGDVDFTLSKNIGYTASQLIPLQGLVRWISTAIDPVYRKAKTAGEQIRSNLPFLSMTLQPYTLPTGEPSKRERINLFMPYDITKSVELYEPLLEERRQQLQQNAVINQLKKQIEEGKPVGKEQLLQVYGAEAKKTKEPLEAIVERKKLEDLYNKADDLFDMYLRTDDPQIRERINQSVSQLGIDPTEGLYNYISKQEVDIKTEYVNAMLGGIDENEWLSNLALLRKEGIASGKPILSDSVIDNLYDEGLITAEQKKYLKNLKWDKKNKKITTKGGAGRKIKIKVPGVAAPKAPKINLKLQVPKSKTIRIKGVSLRSRELTEPKIGIKIK